LYPQSFNLEPALLMMNNPNSPEENIKDIKPLELNQSNILGQPEVNNAKTEMSIKRIEGWFKEDLIDSKQKEELINSGKNLTKKDLYAWLQEEDTKEYLLEELKKKEQENEFNNKIVNWLENIESKNKADKFTSEKIIESNSRPNSIWSPSNSEDGPSSMPKINTDIDQIIDKVNLDAFIYESDNGIFYNFLFSYIVYVIIILCILTIFNTIKKIKYV
jgi:hypothetical protein